ncbi:MAG: MFS transporter [Actinomycetota bacterium]|nr:MFS transporter [Actinomycetota bacterium]
MSDGTAAEETGGQLGVRATWRETPRPVRVVLAGVFVSKLAGFLQIFLVLFLTHRGFSAGQAGLALRLYGAGAVAGTFAGGWLSDRLSTRTTTLISMVGSAVLIVTIVYLRVYPLILAAVLLVSAVGQLYRPAAQSLITELTPPSRLVMVTAMYRLSLNLSTTAAPLIGVALVSVSYNLLFWGEALAAVGYGVIVLTALPRCPRPATAPGEQIPDRGSRSGYLALLTDYRYLVFLSAFFLLCIVYCQYTVVVPLAIVKAGLSIWWYGALITLNAAVVVSCEVWATRFTQAWPTRLTAMSGFALLAVGYGVYSIRLVPVFLIIGTLIWTVSEIVGAPTVYAYPGMVAPAHLRGRYFGAMGAMYGLGATVGPILGVELFDHVGERVFAWAALMAVAGTVISQIGMRGRGAPEPSEPADDALAASS